MRRFLSLLVLTLCLPYFAVAQTTACTGLCLQQVACTGGATTSISGTVYAPNGVDPLPNVLVFIPNGTVDAMTPGVQCPVPGAAPSGNPLVGTTTAFDGTFHLTNVPVGTNIPLIIQAGRWRRQLVVPTTTSCADTSFSTRMPKNQTEGDIPLIAVATGSVDSVECVLRKVGLDDSEFTNPMSTGRIHLYTGTQSAGANIDTTTPSQTTLMNSATELAKYDVLMLPCQGTASGQTSTASLANLLQYANSGGRIYASHFSYAWFYTNGGFSSVASWLGSSTNLNDGTATINTSFSSGQTLSNWLQFVGATTTAGQVSISTVKNVINGINSPTQGYLTLNNQGNPIEQFTFNAPVGSANQCGRVLFNQYHVENPATTPTGKAFPTECSTAAMTNQEKLLEYSLFDLTNAGGVPTMTPATANFGTEAVGFTTAAQTFTWTNNAIFAVSITSATASGDFAVSSQNCQNVAPGASCQIAVVYKPTATGAGNGTLTVTSAANTLTATLTGTGVPALTSSTTSLSFPNTDVGATVTENFTLMNGAPGAVPITGLASSGDYTLANNCGSSLAAGAICTVQVSFKPSGTGARAATVAFGAQSVALSGTGVDFTESITPSSGSVIAGLSVPVPVAVAPVSGFSASVTMTCTTTAPGSTCTPSTSGFVPSATSSVSVVITTTPKYAVIGYGGFGVGILGWLSAFAVTVAFRKKVRVARLAMVLVALGTLCAAMSGCSGKTPAANAIYTAPGTYTYTVTATDGFLVHSATYSLSVTAQ